MNGSNHKPAGTGSPPALSVGPIETALRAQRRTTASDPEPTAVPEPGLPPPTAGDDPTHAPGHRWAQQDLRGMTIHASGRWAAPSPGANSSAPKPGASPGSDAVCSTRPTRMRAPDCSLSFGSVTTGPEPTKVCDGCGIRKPLLAGFEEHGGRIDLSRPICWECQWAALDHQGRWALMVPLRQPFTEWPEAVGPRAWRDGQLAVAAAELRLWFSADAGRRLRCPEGHTVEPGWGDDRVLQLRCAVGHVVHLTDGLIRYGAALATMDAPSLAALGMRPSGSS